MSGRDPFTDELSREYNVDPKYLGDPGDQNGKGNGVPGLPSIVVNDRPLRDVGDDALQALEARNNPPTLFARAGKVIRLGQDENDAPIIQEAGEPVMSHHLTRAANYVKV